MITPVEGSDGRESSVESGASCAAGEHRTISRREGGEGEHRGIRRRTSRRLRRLRRRRRAVDISGLGAYMRTNGDLGEC